MMFHVEPDWLGPGSPGNSEVALQTVDTAGYHPN